MYWAYYVAIGLPTRILVNNTEIVSEYQLQEHIKKLCKPKEK